MTSDYFDWENVRFVPILHNRMEFALEVRQQFELYKPGHIAVEFPPTIKDKVIKGVERLPLLSVVHYEEEGGSFIYLLIEPTDGQVEGIRLAIQNNISVHFIDRDSEGYPLDRSPMPDPYAVTRIGYSAYVRSYLDAYRGEAGSQKDMLRESSMAYHLQQLNRKEEKILFICGLYHLPGIMEMLKKTRAEVIGRRVRPGVGLAHLHEDSSREILSETPFLASKYEKWRNSKDEEPPDRIGVNSELINISKENYWKNSKEELTRGQIRVMNKFARNYAILSGRLVPNFYELIIAARGIADDNFAWEVWDKGCEYPWQTDDPGIPVLRIKGEDLFLDQKRIQFHRRFKSFRRRLIQVPVREKMREKSPGDWKRDFDGEFICSYQPEDIIIEGYGNYLQAKALAIKSEENSRIVPFETSMMDGLDIRQTIREWPNGKIYVKENRPVKGKVGSVVVIFDTDLPDKDGKENFPWQVTWLGEHEQESDMAFYSTQAGEVMDGPGISRCQYGGFMLTYPPLRVYDIWKDDFFNQARSKPERLLMAAIDYCLEKHVVYVSESPPSGWCQSMASGLGKKIIYLPIGIFSPVTLRKIRQFHVLDGHYVRKYAHQYI